MRLAIGLRKKKKLKYSTICSKIILLDSEFVSGVSLQELDASEQNKKKKNNNEEKLITT